MFSIYTTLFNIKTCKFDYDLHLKNFCDFIGLDGEVIVAIPKLTKDDSYQILLDWRIKNNAENLKIFLCDYYPEDPQFDGKVKNFALNQCSTDNILIQCDADEIIPLIQKDKWINYGNFLRYQNDFDAFLIPTIDVWGDITRIRWDEEKNIGLKWRMHKTGLKRGVAAFAQKDDGTHDISLSDSTELLYLNDELVKSYGLVDNECYSSLDSYLNFLKNNIYTVHLGFLDFDNRVLRNKKFWKKMWEIECGHNVDVPLDIENLKYPTYKHGLFSNLKEIL